MRFTRKPWPSLFLALGCIAACFLEIFSARATSVEDGRALFLKGDYNGCLRLAQQNLADSTWDEDWAMLLAQSQMAVGRYPDALKTIQDAVDHHRASVPLRLLAYDVFNANGQNDRAAAVLEELNQLGGSRIRSYFNDPPSLVALGRAALVMNLDPKLVLENFFDQAKRTDPNCREAWLAGGDLALDKHDYALAAKSFEAALMKFPNDPDAEFGLARAFEPSDGTQMAKNLEAVLNYNTNHVQAMMLLVDHMISAEEYTNADIMLDRALKVNPWEPDAWAYRTVLAHLRNDTNAETSAHTAALKYWNTNPRVDYLIGLKLSQDYRFQEGSRFQQQALKFDSNFLPARIQLAQDLLRLGNETDGWQLAGEVHDHDGYDVTAYNLVTLHTAMTKYRTLTNADFIVRMDAHEAEIYGDRVLALLQRAKDRLSAKYGFTLDQPTVVEIFPEQKDFGVRTFGVPHNPGYLGVCFGHVVTANSPAAQAGHPANWEDVLWHEFCHVITLGLSRNKMPRWLSEGISVYEERQADPTWGERMNPRYREMILGEDFTPVSELSSAFMSPKSPLHMQFAYYESSLVVEYLVKNFGLDAVRQVLVDLGDGREINDALARHTEPMDKLEKDFAAFAQDQANHLAPGLDWRRPADDSEDAGISDGNAAKTNLVDIIKRLMRQRDGGPEAPATNVVDVPKAQPPFSPHLTVPGSSATAASQVPASSNYWELVEQAKTALAAEHWAEAKPPLQKLISLYPSQTGPGSAYAMLAAAHRGLNETNEERQVLRTLAAMEDSDTEAFLRLMELDETAADWPGVAENATRFLAVNPLAPQPYRYLAQAGEQLGRTDDAIRSCRRLLLLDPPDPAGVHYLLARLLHRQNDAPGAKRQVLQALEEAPRFRDAQRLLLEIEAGTAAPHAANPLAPK